MAQRLVVKKMAVNKPLPSLEKIPELSSGLMEVMMNINKKMDEIMKRWAERYIRVTSIQIYIRMMHSCISY